MDKSLEDLSLEQLWELFPIFLSEYDKAWDSYYNEEERTLINTIPKGFIKRISHIGSTALKSIYAKPIIDILLEVYPSCDMNEISKNLCDNMEWILMNEQKGRISFNKGYTKNGFAKKVYHLHLRYENDNDELYFRDYLLDNLDIAKEYENLKLKLWKKYEHNRDLYTDAKTDFVKKYTKIAKSEYRGRYD